MDKKQWLRVQLGRMPGSLILFAVLSCVGMAAGAVLMGEGTVPYTMMQPWAYASLILGAVFGGGRYAARSGEKKMLSALLWGGTAFLLLALTAWLSGCIQAAAFAGQAICAITGSILGCVFAVSRPKRRKRR